MKKEISISENFWKEFESRGFSYEKETGGIFATEYKEARIKQHGPKVYQITQPENTLKITIIDPKLFLETVKKIEGMVNFKLFE
ncbi:MAG: hypothetical protein DKM50_09360 [Candidatus Margulisiibacteriota bacterium]|nr:MAG: hypothetical protein A2X43_02250 [Candidatus Margulisbacteria bacterium GWD2_39_127]OGI00896.1 MAG: hypothetical protein A2X42_03125 [Candidatus Margulisbacteria bacterium GWF2_38_17]OGI08751.1 MAG: hypothetical protein A2X41_05380 [Candidatus Margulisbacteria bacterium GWE2_39_32]PZM79462.1 MAG: hypothetical protein DKM50_09360 [Candidatus Margulisiibacteriota bacterium]HAR63484.1 hypothetical protein [Candidatus Margulisiibacteriota bacterium]